MKKVFSMLVIALLSVSVLAPGAVYAEKPQEDNVGDRISDWAATVGKSKEERDRILMERKAERQRERMQRKAERMAKKAEAKGKEAGKAVGKEMREAKKEMKKQMGE